jgi:glutamine cyclotransferase
VESLTFLLHRNLNTCICVLLVLAFTSCEPEKKHETRETLAPVKSTLILNYEVKQKYPHSTDLFTEGFLFHEGKLYESTGSPESQPGTFSAFGELDLQTGKLSKKGELDKKIYFGEGIVFHDNLLYQLTYTNQVCFTYDAKTFRKKGQFSFPNKEGWGITTDGNSLIYSDGTDILTFLNPSTCQKAKEVSVRENGFAVMYLNELEYIRGYIYANVWMSNNILKIDPNTGDVLAKLELDRLFNEARAANPKSLEMNGIAYDSIQDKILVTGKLWPNIFEISFPH